MFLTFGRQTNGGLQELERLIETLPVTYPVLAEIAARRAYQTETGIYDHRYYNKQRPMADVAWHDHEDTLEGSQLFGLMRKYHRLKIHDAFGLSLTEFLEQPPYMVEFQLELVKAEQDQENKVRSRNHKELQDQMGPPPG